MLTIETGFSIFITIMTAIIAICLTIGAISAFRDISFPRSRRTVLAEDKHSKSDAHYRSHWNTAYPFYAYP